MNRQINTGRAKEQSGVILLFVMLLVIMFTGLGLLAMQHVREELRSAGAYMDSIQAASAAESALAMVATDMRANFDLGDNVCPAYSAQFKTADAAGLASFQSHFSSLFDVGGYCAAGQVPLNILGGADGGVPMADTPNLSSALANVTITQERPVVAPTPAGFSSEDNASMNMCWYYFRTTSQATYGSGATGSLTVRGRAVAGARMSIGPVACQ